MDAIGEAGGKEVEARENLRTDLGLLDVEERNKHLWEVEIG